MTIHPTGSRLDDCLIESEQERKFDRRIFISNLRSLAATQKTNAADYRHWATEDGKHSERYAKEAERLEKSSQWYLAWAEREQEELDG